MISALEDTISYTVLFRLFSVFLYHLFSPSKSSLAVIKTGLSILTKVSNI